MSASSPAQGMPSATTPRTDALLNELRQLRSHTLSYPCETQLTELGRTLERELTASNALLGRMAAALGDLHTRLDDFTSRTNDDIIIRATKIPLNLRLMKQAEALLAEHAALPKGRL